MVIIGHFSPNALIFTQNPLKKHWIDGRICLISRAQAQEDILTKLGSNAAGLGAVIRVSVLTIYQELFSVCQVAGVFVRNFLGVPSVSR